MDSQLNIGCESENPENDPHNWPEYKDNEYGDEIIKCNNCNIYFFGFVHRIVCYKCNCK